MLRFNINPAVTSCRYGCFLNTSQVAETVKNLVNSFSFNLSDIGSQTLYVQQPPAFYSWSGQQNIPVLGKLGHELISYHYSSCCFVVLLLFKLLGRPRQKSLRLRRFKSNRDEIWQKCSSSIYASIDGVGCLIRRHTFKMKMVAMTSFRADKCFHLVNAHATSARHLCSSTCPPVPNP